MMRTRTQSVLKPAAVVLFAVVGTWLFVGTRAKNLLAIRHATTSHTVSEISEEMHARPGVMTVYAFLSTNCPISNASIPTLNALAQEFPEFHFAGIVPAPNATRQSLAEFAQRYSIDFPLIPDAQHNYVRAFDATHTPQVVVAALDGFVVYHGAIDDRYIDVAGRKRQFASRHFLKDALRAIRDRKQPAVTSSRPVGCFIENASQTAPQQVPTVAGLQDIPEPEIAANAAVTFNANIAEIIHRRCTRCHRAGEAAPFELISYADIKNHAQQIQDVIRRGKMPPWKPERGVGVFRNEHVLTAFEKESLAQWFAADCPQGTSPPPQPPQLTSGWQLGPPDLILKMPRSFEVPADGPDIYQHFVIPTGLTENRLVNAVEFRPGAAAVVHHAFMYFDTTGTGRKLDAADPGYGYENTGSPGFRVSGSLGGWGPGGIPQRLPAGMGRPLPQNSDLLLQIHYHPIGRAMADQSQVGIYFAPRDATHPVTEMMVADVDLRIPAGESQHRHDAEYVLPENVIVFDCTPHMHVLGRKISVTAHCPDGRTIPLIRINDWDFYWQDTYVFFEPLRLPAHTRIALSCSYDNSAANPLNPHSPPRDVVWGDESTDEMGICYFRVTTETAAEYQRLNEHAGNYFSRLWDRYQQRQAARRK